MARDRKKGMQRGTGNPRGQRSLPAKPDKGIQIAIAGGGVQSITVEMGSLPAPESCFAADFAFHWVASDGDCQLIFVQTAPVSEDPRSVLTIRMSEANFRILAGHSDFMKTLHDAHGGDSPDEQKRAETMQGKIVDRPPERCHTLRASLARMSTLGADAELDFYFISPNRFQDAKAKGDTSGLVLPVASVSVPAKLLSAILHRIEGQNDG